MSTSLPIVVLALPGCANDALTFRVIERACITESSCAQFGEIVTDVAECIAQRTFEPVDEDRVRCLAQAGADCAAADACDGIERRPFTADGEECGTCEGDIALQCWDGRGVTAVDCAVRGDGATCLEGDCVHPECPRDQFDELRHCEGNARVVCSGGFRAHEPCAEGTVCVDDPTLGATCAGAGEPCTNSRCDGEVLETCIDGRLGASFDCGALDGACFSDGVGAWCEPTQTACARGSSSCNGNVLHYCAFSGAEAEFDCVAAGFRGCEDSDERGTARCIPRGGLRD